MGAPDQQHFAELPPLKRCPDCGLSKQLEEFPRNKNSCHLMHRYGIGADDFDRLVAEQGEVCAICGRPDPEHVDHSHETGEVRGILCFNCNGGLGQFRDSVDTLRNAATYLQMRDAATVELREMAVMRAGELRTTPV